MRFGVLMHTCYVANLVVAEDGDAAFVTRHVPVRVVYCTSWDSWNWRIFACCVSLADCDVDVNRLISHYNCSLTVTVDTAPSLATLAVFTIWTQMSMLLDE